MKGLVIIDPEAPGGTRPVNYGLVIEGRKVRSSAVRRFVDRLAQRQIREAEEEALMSAWVQRELATAPKRTVLQEQMLRRTKGELVKLAQAKKAQVTST
ncbi:hypothetical protein [Streptomyces sp. NPDC001089]